MIISNNVIGWRREVVYRATVDPGTKTLCDVYYYAPDGKKLRSGREVAMHRKYHKLSYVKSAKIAYLLFPFFSAKSKQPFIH